MSGAYNPSPTQELPLIVWITGLPNAGKTTFGVTVSEALRSNGIATLFLDGDSLRGLLDLSPNKKRNITRRARVSLSKFYLRLAEMIAHQGIVVVVATVSLFKEIEVLQSRSSARLIKVLLDPPSEILVSRDSRATYSKFSSPSEYLVGNGMRFPAEVDFRFELPGLTQVRDLTDCVKYLRSTKNEN